MKDTLEKLIVIGLDGADWRIIKPWMDQGKLPALTALAKKGVSQNLLSTIPPLTGPALASFFTGFEPVNTGVAGFFNADGSIMTLNDIDAPCIWDYLGSQNIQCLVAGLRLTYPPREINGIMISGGLNRPKGEDYVQPAHMIDHVRGFHPSSDAYPMLSKALASSNVGDPATLTDELIALTSRQFDIFNALHQDKGPFPFSLLYVENTDLLQHFCWDAMDQILRLYQCVDRHLDNLIKDHSEAGFLVFSDHGFYKVPSKNFNINTCLSQKGVLTPAGISIKSSASRKIKNLVKEKLYDPLSMSRKRRLKALLGKIRPGKAAITGGLLRRPSPGKAGLDIGFTPESTQSYAAWPWGIHLNHENLDTNWKEFRDWLIGEMRAMKTPDGQPLFSTIMASAEAYQGRYLGQLPEIVFLVDEKLHVSTKLEKDVFTTYSNPEDLQGVHDQSRKGVLIAKGPGILGDTNIAEPQIVDLLPTILAYFGITPATALDGRPLTEIIESPKPIMKSVETTGQDFSNEKAYNIEEEQEIKKRLKSLGYL